MKKCPMCGASALDDAPICFECLYSFDLMSCVAMAPEAGGAAGESEEPQMAPLVEPEGTVRPSDFQVVVVDDEFGQRVFEFVEGSLHVGRLPTNEIVLNDRTVSRRHLHIFFEQGQVWVEDFGATNSSVLNGQPMSGRALLHVGDTLQVRSAILKLVSR